MAYIKSICDRWRSVRAVFYDHTGTKGIDEQINRAGFPNVEGIDFTRPLKHGMAMTLKQLMMSLETSFISLVRVEAEKAFYSERSRRIWESQPLILIMLRLILTSRLLKP